MILYGTYLPLNVTSTYISPLRKMHVSYSTSGVLSVTDLKKMYNQ